MLQDVKRVLADEDQQFQNKMAKKIDVLGDAPLLFQDTAMAAGNEMAEAIDGLKSCLTQVKEEGDMSCIKDVRVRYRGQNGSAVFKHVQGMVKVKGEFMDFIDAMGCKKEEVWTTIDAENVLDEGLLMISMFSVVQSTAKKLQEN